jgi:hypothetical protein
MYKHFKSHRIFRCLSRARVQVLFFFFCQSSFYGCKLHYGLNIFFDKQRRKIQLSLIKDVEYVRYKWEVILYALSLGFDSQNTVTEVPVHLAYIRVANMKQLYNVLQET